MADKASIKFRYAPSMPMERRFWWIGGLLLGGFAVQYMVSPFVGWLLFLAGCMMGIMQGRSLKPEFATETGDWQTTTIEELEDVEKLSQEISEWRGKSGTFCATSMSGCLLAGLAATVIFVGAVVISTVADRNTTWFAAPISGGAMTPVWLLDAFTAMVPIWFAGTLKAWEPPELPRKARYLLGIYEAYKSQPALEFLPSLLVTKSGETSVPSDCKLLVRIKDAPKEFIGIQVQVSLNYVQGTAHPYCYSVLIAKHDFQLKLKAVPHLDSPPGKGLLGGLFKDANEKREAEFCRFNGSIAETTSESDTEVVVIRQVTVGSGYATSEEQALKVFANALGLAWKVIWPKPK